jgi:Flp pilus assembly CpaF family ATPase
MNAAELQRVANLRRADAVTMIHRANTGHTGGAMSCLDALTCAGVYEDDSLIQRLTVTKKEPQPPDGLAVVRITEYEQKETRGAGGAGPPVP